MKNQRTASTLGIIVGVALLAVAAYVLPGCTNMPPYIGIGFHFTTTPPTPRPDVIAIQPTAGAPAAAARP